MIISIQILFITLLFLFNPQIEDGSKLLNELQEKYESVDDFHADFRLETVTGNVETGKFYYKSVDKFKIELKSITMISDGESVWNYTQRNNKVIITPIEDNENSFSINDYVFEFPAKCNVTRGTDEKGRDILLLKPKSTELNFKEMKIIVNSEKLIDEIHLTDFMDQGYRVYLSSTKVNQKLSDNFFIFEPSDGIQVIDLR
ncbi:MAG: outer membrane lipoprotein carrier protein LolA [Ignavibacteriales bacterium]|nr:MAG: outer membrane lipoprotein carrier protein LolA [Ignavibacteriales bacterium]